MYYFRSTAIPKSMMILPKRDDLVKEIMYYLNIHNNSIESMMYSLMRYEVDYRGLFALRGYDKSHSIASIDKKTLFKLYLKLSGQEEGFLI